MSGNWFVGLVVAAAVTAACGGDDTASAETVLRVVLADDWVGAEPVVEAVRTFEAARPGVRVQLQGFPFSQILDTVRSGIDAGEPHDVVQWHPFAAAAQGLAEPLDDLWDEHLDVDDYISGAVTDVTWAGRRYGIPLDTNALLLMTNPGLIEQSDAGATAPRTFDEFERIAATVTAPDGSVRGTAVTASSWTTYGWIRANGGEIVSIDDDGRPTFTLDAPEVIEAVDFLGRLVTEEAAFPPFSRDVSTDAFALFKSGVTALHTSGTWDVAALERSVAWEPEVHPLPGGVDGTTRGSALGGSGLFTPAGSPNRDLAFEFMLHLTADEVAIALVEQEGRLPARRSAFEAPFFDEPLYDVVRSQLDVAHPMLLIAFPEATQAFKEATEAVFTGRASAAEALATAQAIAEASVGGAT